MIQHNKPQVTSDDRAAVDRVLASGMLAGGPEVAALERDLVCLYGAGEACAVSSGTAALFLALKWLGVGGGRRVAVPTYSCAALLNAVYMAGATPVPIDVYDDNFTVDVDALQHAANEQPIAATIAVHTYGAPANVAAMRRFGGIVIEDCCQSIGGSVAGSPLGGDGAAAVFSLYATKIVTCGHGGLLYDPSGRVAEAARDYREFDLRRQYTERFNFHLTEFQAAMARSQLARLEAIAERRRAIAARYLHALIPPAQAQAGLLAAGRMVYRFVLKLPNVAVRDALREHLRSDGIETIVPVERWELLHRYLGLDPGRFPGAERLADTTLSLPLYPALADADVDRICASLRRAPVPTT